MRFLDLIRCIVRRPDRAWVMGITHIRTWQGWLYLALVTDLFSRLVVGQAMQPTLARELVVDVLLIAAWRRKAIRSGSTAAIASDASAARTVLSPA